MTERPTRRTVAGATYLDLRRLAAETRRPTDELLQYFALEGFLDRLAISRHANDLVLKGGVLLAAFGSRRPTRDIDLASIELEDDLTAVRTVIDTVLAVDLEDGLTFDPTATTVGTIRDDDISSGARAGITGLLSSARIRFHVDINFGDPLWPAPQPVWLPRLLGGSPIRVLGYRIELVLAEKIVTALQRGTANTRWRDFVDIAELAGRETDTEDLIESISRVAAHRRVRPGLLADALEGFAEGSQSRWAAWRRRQDLSEAPDSIEDLLDIVVAFSDQHLGRLQE